MDLTGKKVVVIGGGAVGLDVIEFFSERKAKTSIVEMLPMLGKDLDVVSKSAVKEMLKKYDVDVNTSTALVEVNEDNFKVKKDEKEVTMNFDYGFVCLGMRSQIEGLKEIQEYFGEKNVEVVNIGDSVRARKIIDGVREGRDVILALEKIGVL